VLIYQGFELAIERRSAPLVAIEDEDLLDIERTIVKGAPVVLAEGATGRWPLEQGRFPGPRSHR